MRTEKSEPAATKQPSICDRLQRAFHTRPAFRPFRRLAVRHQDGATPGGLPTPVLPPPPARPPAAAGALGPAAPPVHGSALLVADKVDKPHQGGEVRASSPSVVATTAEKATATPAGAMPVPAPPPGVSGRPGDSKAIDNAQHTIGKTRTGSRVRNALSSK